MENCEARGPTSFRRDVVEEFRMEGDSARDSLREDEEWRTEG